MKTSFFKRSIAGMLAFAFLLTTMLSVGGTTAFAAGTQEKVYIVSFPRSSDVSSNIGWGHPAHSYLNGWSAEKSEWTDHPRHRRLQRTGVLLHRTRRVPADRRYPHTEGREFLGQLPGRLQRRHFPVHHQALHRKNHAVRLHRQSFHKLAFKQRRRG